MLQFRFTSKTPAIAKEFKTYMKLLKKSGIPLRQATLMDCSGNTLSQEGNELSTRDIDTIRHVLLAERDLEIEVIHLESLYYCVKHLTKDLIILFNGCSYIVASVSESQHFFLINIKAKKDSCAQAAVWLQKVTEQMSDSYIKSKGAKNPVKEDKTEYNPIRRHSLDWF